MANLKWNAMLLFRVYRCNDNELWEQQKKSAPMMMSKHKINEHVELHRRPRIHSHSCVYVQLPAKFPCSFSENWAFNENRQVSK